MAVELCELALHSVCMRAPSAGSASQDEREAVFERLVTGNPSSLVTVNMTLRNGVITRVSMGNTSILRNSSKLDALLRVPRQSL